MKKNSSYYFLVSKKLMELANILTFVMIVGLIFRPESRAAVIQGILGIIFAWGFGLYFLFKLR